jgi:energy-coupling factor transport system ATP-binding protein
LPAAELEEVWFKYAPDQPDVLQGLSYRTYAGEFSALLGGNGTGKSTLLKLLAGLCRPYRGRVRLNGEDINKIPGLFDGILGVLPQNPQTLFTGRTVREDLWEFMSEQKISAGEKRERFNSAAALCRLEEILDFHPYDLSGGEQQRAALAKTLLPQPRILLLDEPTKGLDAEFKLALAGILRRLTAAGTAVIMSSHDIEFCAEHADNCALLFDGAIAASGPPRFFFSGNSFYTSAAHRIARAFFPEALTVAEVITALGGQPSAARAEAGKAERKRLPPESPPAVKPADQAARRAVWSAGRRAAAALGLLLLFGATALAITDWDGWRTWLAGGDSAWRLAGEPAADWKYAGMMLAFSLGAVNLTLALIRRRKQSSPAVEQPVVSRRLSKRTRLAAVLAVFAIPLTVYSGNWFFGDRKYYFIALLIILETLLPFALVFESRKPQARELVVIAALCALAVAGRAAFFMLPQFKPVTALVIISGVAFGGEAGFLVGALTGFLSNMFFGQGPWTPWQMFAFGLIGFLAGVLFSKGWLSRERAALAVYGGLATLVIYGGIMNPAHVLISQTQPVGEMFLAAYVQGIPFDLIHAAATVTFLLLLAPAMLEKLDRIKVKYGLLESRHENENENKKYNKSPKVNL